MAKDNSKIGKTQLSEDAFGLLWTTKEHYKTLRENVGLRTEFKAVELSYSNAAAYQAKGIARVRTGVLHRSVERFVPKMDKINFPADGEFLEVRPKDKDDDLAVEDAEATTKLLKEQFADIGVRRKLIPIYRDLAKYGTIFIKVFWDSKTVKRFKRVNGVRQEVYEVVYDNPDFYSPNIWDVYVDPKDTDLDGWVIEKIPVNFSDLWEQRKRTDDDGDEVGIYDVETLKRLRDVKVMKDVDDTDKEDSDEIRGVGNHTYGPGDHKLFLWQAQGPVPKYLLTGDMRDMEEKTIVENAVIEVVTNESGQGEHLRTIDNPNDHGMKMIIKGQYLSQSNRAYGLGMIYPNLSLEAEVDTVRNQAIDSRTMEIKKKFIVDRNANIDTQQLQDIHGQIIETDLMSGIKELTTRDSATSAMAHVQQAMIDVEDGTGSTKLLAGTPSGSSLDRTAAGVATVVQGGLDRLELVVTQFQEDIMKKLVEHFWMLNQQFLPEGRDVALTGKGIIRVVPEEIPFQGFDLNFLGVRELGEKEFKLNSLNILLQNVSPFIPLGLDPMPILEKFFKLAGMGDLFGKVDKRPEGQLEHSPEGEVQLLQLGNDVRINFDDNHDSYLQAYEQNLLGIDIPINPLENMEEYAQAFEQAVNSAQLADNVKRNLRNAVGQRLIALRITAEGKKDTSGQ